MGGSDHSPVGLAGRLVTATRGADGVGEVEVRIRGGTEVFMARSDDRLPRGRIVLVVSVLGPRTVFVTPWDEPPAGLSQS